jgi:dynein heavy chain
LNPIIFVLSPGSNPVADIQQLWEELAGFTCSSCLHTVSLGQGQGKVAMDLLHSGYSKGDWIVMQNCHLLPSWLKNLDSLLDSTISPHNNFLF